ncbi:MAG: hypothetical protein J07HQW2_00099 [Haloquadratum walsbyi J07HQW2]|uniref:Uncharacterized protein n=1 Tax=Haloquadratum walsbyi J07HQW2 TaxID=1238425 RepID=U1PN40_9EURY|nr:MAG: hypothetical protein J07HQW2_00099 [Haloquadratum walsbyi J07HQW2]
MDADDLVGLVVFDDLNETIDILDRLRPRDVFHLDGPVRTGLVLIH